MANFLENLLPKNPVIWYPMDERLPNGFPAIQVLDFGGGLRHLSATAPSPDYQNSNFFPHNNIYCYPDRNSLKSAANGFSLKHLFTLAAFDGANNFGANFRGLFSGLSAGNAGVLVGNTNAVRFFNAGYSAMGDFIYRKSQIAYPESNQVAPFGKMELLEISLSTGWLLDGAQLGGDRGDATRRWSGRIGETIGFSRVLTAAEVSAVNLYYDLKYGLWRVNLTTLNFPNPILTGILYSRFFAGTPDYKKTTVSHEYDDGGKSFSETALIAPRFWDIEFNCVAATHAEAKAKSDIFDAFYEQARYSRTFDFTDKYGETHSNVRIEDYNRSHSGHKSWSQNCRFRLVKLP